MHELDLGWCRLPLDMQLVGSILHNPEHIHKAAECGVEDSYFADDFARQVWQSMHDCVAADIPISVPNVGMKLGVSKSKEFVDLVGYSPITCNFRYFLEDFLKAAAVRKATEVAKKQRHLDPEAKAKLVLDTVRSVTGKLSDEQTIMDVASDWAEELDARWTGKKTNGVKIHIPELQSMLGGLQEGGLYVFGARPGTGKTAFAVNVASRCVFANERVVFATIEMVSRDIFSRFLCLRARVSWEKLRDCVANDSEMDRVSAATKALSRAPLDIAERWGGRWELLEPILESKLREKDPPKLIILDHLHIMKLSACKENRVEELGELTGSIKRFALMHKVPVLLLCQFNRSVENEKRQPRMSDLRGSGSIEQDADAVMLMHSQDYSHHLILAKNRNGRPGRIALSVDLTIGEIKGDDFESRN